MVRITDNWLAIGLASRQRLGIGIKRCFPGRIDKAVGDDFLIIQPDPHLAQGVVGQHGFVLRQHARRRGRWLGRNVVVAEQAHRLFDQVFLDGQVEAEARRRDDQVVVLALNGCTQRDQATRDLIRIEFDPTTRLRRGKRSVIGERDGKLATVSLIGPA